jgi:hypothetical protein
VEKRNQEAFNQATPSLHPKVKLQIPRLRSG